jgi:hypothetical protein
MYCHMWVNLRPLPFALVTDNPVYISVSDGEAHHFLPIRNDGPPQVQRLSPSVRGTVSYIAARSSLAQSATHHTLAAEPTRH